MSKEAASPVKSSVTSSVQCVHSIDALPWRSVAISFSFDKLLILLGSSRL